MIDNHYLINLLFQFFFNTLVKKSMIVSIVLRNFKTYNKNYFIPITNKEKFCALVGDNGVGKSSILEALNCYFKGKDWTLNISLRKNKKIGAVIVPIFLIRKNKISKENLEVAQTLSDYIWSFEANEANSANRTPVDDFIETREFLQSQFSSSEFFLLPLGITNRKNATLSVFNTSKLSQILFPDDYDGKRELMSEEHQNIILPLVEEVKSHYHYIYIPKDIDPSEFVKLETVEIQELMGESLNRIISSAVPRKDLNKINTNLNEFLKKVSTELGDYEFRTSENRQSNIKASDINNLIVQAFFSIRGLYKIEGDHKIKMADLSSGEKQKAIIEVAHNLIANHRKNSDNLIIAIDEPESSLHISACFQQFRKLFGLSTSINQLIFSTHWYGFIPIIESGSVTAITKTIKEHQFDNLDIENYREQIRKKIQNSKGILPFDIRLKSINDFIQTLVSSLIDQEEFNWIICEGSSEKVYFSHYFKDYANIKNLNIIPVGGAGEVRRIYESFHVAIKEFKSELFGKILFLIDTDAELNQFETFKYKNTLVQRLINKDEDKNCHLVKVKGGPTAPVTDIEKVLNGEVYLKTLNDFKREYSELNFLPESISDEKKVLNSYYSMDLRMSEQSIIDDFFKKPRIKYLFAKKYVANALHMEHVVNLNWVNQIASFFKGEDVVVRDPRLTKKMRLSILNGKAKAK